MAFDHSDYTFFAVVQRDNAGNPVVVKLQSNFLPLDSNGFPDGTPWGWSGPVNIGGVDISPWLVLKQDDAIEFRTGYLALNIEDSGGNVIPAAPFLSTDTATIAVTVPGTTGGSVNIQCRALPSLDLVGQTGTSVGPVGGAQLAPTLPFHASADASWSGGIQWSSDAGLVFSAPGASPLVDGSTATPGTFALVLDSSPAAPETTAVFDNVTSVPLPDASETILVGAIEPELFVDDDGPTVDFGAAPLHVGVTSAGPSAVAIPVTIEDLGSYLRKGAVTINLELTRRDDPSVTVDSDLTYNVNSDQWEWSVDPTTFAAPVTPSNDQAADGPQSPILPSFNGDYADAATIVESLTWSSLSFDVPADYESLRLSVDATDASGNATSVVHEALLEIPTDIVLCLDRSGSMNQIADGTTTKWQAAGIAANTFHVLFREVTGAIGGPVPLANSEGVAYFHWVAGADATTDPVALAAPAAGALPPAPATGPVAAGAASGGTPIGEGVLKSRTALLASPAEWRRRVVFLMTDGKENRGTTLAAILADGAIAKPVAGSPQPADLIVHGITFGSSADTDEPLISDFSSQFGGLFRSTATFAGSPTDPGELILAFADMLVDSIPSVNRATSGLIAAGTMVPVEDGVSRAVFVLDEENPAATLEYRADSGSAWGPTGATANDGGGITYFTVDAPSAGEYRLVSASGSYLALYDLRLRADFSVEGADEVGATLTLRARITDGGAPVTDATVVANVTTPGYSEGELIGRWAKVSKARYIKAKRKLKERPSLLRAPYAVKLGKSRSADDHSARFDRVRTAASFFDMPVHVRAADPGIVLSHVGDGVYEADFANTSNEGAYGFAFEARGSTLAGNPFSRGYSVARVLEPVPDADLSTFEWFQIDPKQWVLTVKPVQRSGHPVGPGQTLSVVLGDGKPVTLKSQLDGRYIAKVGLDPKQPIPKLTLVDRRGRETPLTGASPGSCGHRVRITLEAVQIDDLDGDDDAKLAFAAVVAPNGDRARAKTTRLPIVRAKLGKKVEIGELVYDGIVTDPSSLVIGLSGSEVELRSYLAERPKDGKRLARYLRRLTGSVASWAGDYEPRDECPDPEELEDWKVWYRVEVI